MKDEPKRYTDLIPGRRKLQGELPAGALGLDFLGHVGRQLGILPPVAYHVTWYSKNDGKGSSSLPFSERAEILRENKQRESFTKLADNMGDLTKPKKIPMSSYDKYKLTAANDPELEEEDMMERRWTEDGIRMSNSVSERIRDTKNSDLSIGRSKRD